MTQIFYTGQALGRAQVTKVIPSVVEIGDTFTLTINKKAISVVATEATVSNIVALFVIAIGQFANESPEWTEVSASSGHDDLDNVTHLLLTGKADGTPFTVTASTTNAATFNISVVEVVKGVAAKNQKQRVHLEGTPTSGNFKLSVDGGTHTTADIAYNANAATVLAAIEALASIGAANTSVTLNGTGDWTVEFVSALANINMPVFTGAQAVGAALGGQVVIQINVQQDGRPLNYARGPTLSVAIANPPVDSFRFKFTGGSAFTNTAYYSPFVPNGPTGATSDQIRIALESILVPDPLVSDTGTADLPGIALTHAYRALDVVGPTGGPWVITVRDGVAASFNDDALEISDIMTEPGILGGNGLVDITLVSSASTAAINEVQSLVLANGPTAGTFTISLRGTTSPTIQYKNDGIQYNTAGTTVISKYDLRDAICDIGVAYDAGSGTFLGRNELQTLTATGTWSAGNFTLTVATPYGTTTTTGNIPFNATATQVQTAINGVLTAVVGAYAGESMFVECGGGPLPGTPVTIKYRRSMGRQSFTAAVWNIGTVTGVGPGATVVRTVNGVQGDVWVTGSGTPSDPFLITFDKFDTPTQTFAGTGTYAGKNVEPFTAANSLTGAGVISDVIQLASLGVSEQQEIMITPNPATGGTFTLTLNAETTGAIAYNATPATVQTAIEGLATPVPGDVVVTGPAGGPWLVQFAQNYANTDVSLFTGMRQA
jgi:hypothetical protein